MNTKNQATLLFLALTTNFTFAQGDLNPPPGGPTATMKTLDQLEARTPIPKTSGSPVAGPHFIISQPGSYYLTGNITVSTGDAIVIPDGVNDVSLDLNGFTIASTLTGSASGSAIDMPGAHSRITVCHGNISSGTTVTYQGVATPAGFQNGIDGFNALHVNVTQVHVNGVASRGIFALRGNFSECTASHCGISGLSGEIVTNSSADNCGAFGISALNATNCNGEAGSAYGLNCSENATNCTGFSYNSRGINCSSNATNCTGISIYGTGFYCEGNATNCRGTSSNANSYGMSVAGTASSCRARNTAGGPAIYAAIAIGCTSDGGAISSPSKHLGTP
jgi:hypothetical protein